MESMNFTKNSIIASSYHGSERRYWVDKLSGDLLKATFPFDFSKNGNDRTMNSLNLSFPPRVYSEIMKLMNGSDYKLFMILLAGLVVLLEKYTGNKDVIVGAPILRQKTEGEFINTVLTLRNKIENGMTFKDLLFKVRQEVIDSNTNQNYPIEILMHQLNLPFSKEDFQLFDVSILLENIHNIKHLEHIHTNVIFSFHRNQEEIVGFVQFNASLYEESTIKRMIGHYHNLFQKALANVNLKLSEIDILSDEERKLLLQDFNKTQAPYPQEATIQELFDRQIESIPDKIALVFEQQHLSYEELNQKSNQLARILQDHGVKPNSTVAILVEPSVEMITGILAILKSGGAFLPLDPENSKDRLHYMLEDSESHILLTQKHLYDKVRFKGMTLELDDSQFYQDKTTNLDSISRPGDLLYMIYTSGTTGKPKAVEISHENLSNYLSWFASAANITVKDKTALISSFAFDLGYTAMFSAILNGGELHLIRKNNYLLVENLLTYIQEHSITYLKLTPSFFSTIAEHPEFAKSAFQSVRLLVLGGEAINTRDVEKTHTIYPQIQIMNHYGPTEATIGCIAQFIDFNRFDGYKRAPTIGMPIHNMSAYIVDRALNLLPFGVPGELCVSGRGVAQGYFNRPTLTAERFVANPFKKNQRMYKTGDLAKWRSDGKIEFLGRMDQQIKVRGYRIELGEIEAQLLNHDNIKECVVMARTDKDEEKYLCAYFVSNQKIGISELREYLFTQLPDYMIPAHLIQIDRIPLTENGKIDKRALPAPGMSTSSDFVSPRDTVEKKVAELWSQVLKIEREIIGIDDNFFELGGHSLKATMLISKIHRHLNVKVPLVELFVKPTIRALSTYIRHAAPASYHSIQPAAKKEYYAVSSAQKRLYLLQEFEKNSTSYNRPYTTTLEGELCRDKLENIFGKLIRRHESPRTSFHMIDDELVQKIQDEVRLEIEYHAVDGECAPEIVERFIRPFDLSQAPLLRVGLIQIEEKKHILMVDMHHIITDGLSMLILLREFMKIYGGVELPAMRIQYKDYSEWQNSAEYREMLQKQESFWLNEFTKEPLILNLPSDYSRPLVQKFEGDTIGFSINKGEAESLRDLALKEESTLYMVLFTVFNIFLAKLSGQDDIIVGTDVAGRQHSDTENIMGMFVNTLAIRSFPSSEKTFREFLSEVKKKTLAAFDNQDYPFESLVSKVVRNRDASRNPLFDVMFSFYDMDIQSIRLPDLRIVRYERRNRTSKFDLMLHVTVVEENIYFFFEYSTHLFKKDTIEYYVKVFKEIVSIVLSNASIRLKDISITHDLITAKANVSKIEFAF